MWGCGVCYLSHCPPRLFHNSPPLWVQPSRCESSPPWLPISTPPTGLDECFFFISLVVGLLCGSIFCQFWLVFVFKLLSFFGCAKRHSVCTYASILARSQIIPFSTQENRQTSWCWTTTGQGVELSVAGPHQQQREEPVQFLCMNAWWCAFKWLLEMPGVAWIFWSPH